MSTEVVLPETGEVLSPEEAQRRANAIARELVVLDPALREAEAEAERLRDRRGSLTTQLEQLVGTEGRADGGPAWAVVVPGPQGRRSVIRTGCDRHAEQLVSLGLARWEQRLAYPKVADVERRRAELVAAGVPLEDLVTRPEPGPPSVEIVPKGGE